MCVATLTGLGWARTTAFPAASSIRVFASCSFCLASKGLLDSCCLVSGSVNIFIIGFLSLADPFLFLKLVYTADMATCSRSKLDGFERPPKNRNTWCGILGYGLDTKLDSTPRELKGWWHRRCAIHY